MNIVQKLRQVIKSKKKVVIFPQDARLQRQLDYINRSQTPNIRVDAIQKRISDRGTRR